MISCFVSLPRRALASLLLALLTLAACTARERFVPGGDEEQESSSFSLGATAAGHIDVFDLSRGAPEQAAGGLFKLPADQTYMGLVRQLSKSLADNDTKGVFVRLSQQNYDWAQVEELGQLLAKFKKAKKRVTCHAHSLTNSTTWLFLQGCDRVWLSPAGEVTTVGIAAQMTYLKGALDKLKVKADFLHMGRFKSGGEPMTQEGPSEASRANLTETLRSIRKTWLDGASSARKSSELRQALESGPFVPEAAKARGLIDAVGYESEALDEAKEQGKTDQTKVVFGPGRDENQSGLTELVRILAGSGDASSDSPHIAVVPSVGGITMSGSGGIGSGGITADAMVPVLRRLKKSDSVKAVVLRLDSPGGSPLASDLIWKEVMDLRQKKPVIASVGGMAASGGYYIACAASRIVAERTSIVGSIGVFGGKFVIGPALEEVGITSFTFPASPEPGAAARAAYMSPLTAWDEATRKRVESHMAHIYELFLRRVAKGRSLPLEKIKQNAEGAIFTGSQGKSRGLVDQLGGLAEALALAKRKAGLPLDAPVALEGLQHGFIESLFSKNEPVASDAQAAVVLSRAKQQEWQALVPEHLRSFIGSLLPLVQGEHSLVALPYVFEVR